MNFILSDLLVKYIKNGISVYEPEEVLGDYALHFTKKLTACGFLATWRLDSRWALPSLNLLFALRCRMWLAGTFMSSTR